MPERGGGLFSIDGEWQEQAACRHEPRWTMYPTDDTGQQRAAKAVCLRCPVRDVCLQTALNTGEKFGTWGGLGEAPRKRLGKFMRAHSDATLTEAVQALNIAWSPPESRVG